MKTVSALIVLLLAFASVAVYATQYGDLPYGGQRAPNMVTFPAGSLIIDMGDRQIESITSLNISQPRVLSPGETTTVGPNAGYAPHPSTKRVGSTAGLFNMYAYGYAVHLLHNNIPLSWVIKSNKGKDDIDFYAQSVRIRPSTDPSLATYYNGGKNYGQNTNWDKGGTYGTPGNFSFRGGPLVIGANFASQALSVLNTFIANQTRDYNYTSTSAYGMAKSVVVYNLTASASLDVRHLLAHKPYVIVSQLSGQIYHYGSFQQLLENSGMRQGDIEGDNHWQSLSSGEVLAGFDENTCVTLFAEPHIVFDPSPCDGCYAMPQYRSALTAFVNSGGNFYAQCAAIGSYENSLWNISQFTPVSVNPELYHNVTAIPESFRGKYPNMVGAFQSKYGFRGLGNGANTEWGGACSSSAACKVLNYPNGDLPLVQFLGDFEGQYPGTVTDYFMQGYANDTDDTLWTNGGHGLVVNTFSPSAQDGEPSSGTTPKVFGSRLLPANRKSYIASASKLTDYDAGGIVIYSASHSWFYSFGNADNTLPSAVAETVTEYNGRRLFFNAVLTPVTRPAHCGLSICTDTCSASTQQTLGNCQTCSCQSYSEVVVNNQSMCSGSCSVCSAGGKCVPSTCASGSTCLGSGNTYNCIANSPSPSSTPSVTPSRSASPSSTPSISISPSPSATPSPSVSASPSRSASPSATPSPSVSATPSSSSTSSPSDTPSASSSPSRSATRSPSKSPSATSSISVSSSPSSSSSPSPSASETPSPSATASKSRSPSKSKSRSRSRTPSPSSSSSSSPSPSASPSATASASRTPSKSKSRSPSVTPSPSPVFSRREVSVRS
eukprot:TRINITY_DN6_c0_g2_i3.p1 TRINITY_DN6_c0_g2~~TRINITY_DN6_c0_g2_i3.p1  ORF type:complete len:833 (-),score=104.14 TRINITY_DN6_c0_g2_i3:75-2573(-)